MFGSSVLQSDSIIPSTAVKIAPNAESSKLANEIKPDVRDWREDCIDRELKYKHLFKTKIYSDIVFTIEFPVNEFSAKLGDSKIYAHSFVLKMASPVFEKMIDGDFKEKSKEILIKDIDYETFYSFIRFLYLEKIDISSFVEAWEIYDVATKYMVANLQKYCLDYIKKNVSVNTAFVGYEWAERYDLAELKTSFWETILQSPITAMECPEFLCIQPSTLARLLDSQSLPISELNLFINFEKWLNNNADNDAEKVKIFKEFLPKFSFFSMTPKDFMDGPCLSDFLTVEEKLSLLANIVAYKSYPLIDGLLLKPKTRQPHGTTSNASQSRTFYN